MIAHPRVLRVAVVVAVVVVAVVVIGVVVVVVDVVVVVVVAEVEAVFEPFHFHVIFEFPRNGFRQVLIHPDRVID